jgi:hypothetical protein
MGPYCYLEYQHKINITWEDNANLIRYIQQKYYVWNPKKSCPTCQQNDTFVTSYVSMQAIYANPAFNGLPLGITRQQVMRALMCSIQDSPMVNGDLAFTPFQHMPVEGAIFGYFNDPIIERVNMLLTEVNLLNQTVADYFPGIASHNYTSVSESIRRLNTDTYYTGKDNITNVQAQVLWQNMSLLYNCPTPSAQYQSPPFEPGVVPVCAKFQNDWTEAEIAEHGYFILWGDADKNAIRGYSELNVAPGFETNSRLEVFVTDIYRKGFIQNYNAETVNDAEIFGVEAKRFRIPPEMYFNATLNPDNTGYYAFHPSGMLNLSTVSGFPFFVSSPNFVGGDPALQRALVGLQPNETTDNTWVDYHQRTGHLIRANKMLQLNAFLIDWALPATHNLALCSLINNSPNYKAELHCCTAAQVFLLFECLISIIA